MVSTQRRMRPVIRRLASGPRAMKLRSIRGWSLRARISAGSDTSTTSTIPGTRICRAMTSAHRFGPRVKAIQYVRQSGSQRRCVAQQHLAHAVVFDPINSGRGIDLGGVVVGQKAIALDATPGHDDENAE